MSESARGFSPENPDSAGVLSWVHIGDLHMTRAGEQNDLDLQAIVEEINEAFAGSVGFVYLPGDIADDGSRAAYEVVRRSLDRLRVPWCSIVGDHDVHEKSFDNYAEWMNASTHYSFTAGPVRFLALNAFDIPHPASFAILPDQLHWIDAKLAQAARLDQTKVLLLHCYPSDLKVGRAQLTELVRKHRVRLIDMGHTHYNEIANDGLTLYTATRSTGQIEEGPVGFSVTNIDRGLVSWRFLPLGELPAVIITSPCDERLLTGLDPASGSGMPLRLRAKVWGRAAIDSVRAVVGDRTVDLEPVPGSRVWEASLDERIPDGACTLSVTARDAEGRAAGDSIRIRAGRDQDYALPAWPEHGLLGTQLGPNKNGKKW